VFTLKRVATGEALEEHDTEAEHLRVKTERSAMDLFGRKVLEGATQDADGCPRCHLVRPRQLLDEAANDAEVVDEDVCWINPHAQATSFTSDIRERGMRDRDGAGDRKRNTHRHPPVLGSTLPHEERDRHISRVLLDVADRIGR